MNFLIRQRGTGKTTAAIAWLQDNPDGVLLVHSEQYAAHLRKEHGLTQKQVMSAHSSALRGRKVSAVAVDNLDLILGNLLGTGHAPVSLVTATGESI